jgi:elongation factor Ts
VAINPNDVKKLRDMTGAGMMDAKKALEEAGGDFDKAIELLRLKGVATAAKRSDREAKAGVIEGYVHAGRIGVLVEVNCETDFVARTEDFKIFAHDIAMQVAASSPTYLAPSDIPEGVLEKEKAIYAAEAKDKPEAVAEKMVAGKLEKYYQSVCLTKQAFIKDDTKNIEDLTKELIAKVGENVVVRRMVRLELGEIGG